MTTMDTPAETRPTMPRCGRSLEPLDSFARRHIGPRDGEIAGMLSAVGFPSMDALIDATVPRNIRLKRPMTLSAPADRERGEAELLAELRAIAQKNRVFRSCIGTGYHGTVTPGVILRNILENPGWYTQYTPYQSEISQGRLEALLNFQTMIADLTGLPVAGASLLDEGTAAAEAMAMCHGATGRARFLVAEDCHPQTIAVVRTRAASVGVEVVVADVRTARLDESFCGVLVQYPTTDGRVECYKALAEAAHSAGALLVAAADPLALTLLTPPGEWGADIAVGSAQRFGVPMGFGGPHAAYLATTDKLVRRMPGRIIGVSRDAAGKQAYRMAIQTREQHIKRERATSNICTAQALLAIMAGMYGVYHGPRGVRAIAERVRLLTQALRAGLLELGHKIGEDLVFDTLRVAPAGRSAAEVARAARERMINLREFPDGTLGVTLDELSDERLVADLLAAFGARGAVDVGALAERARRDIPPAFARSSAFMTHPVFNAHHSETEMLRYIFKLQGRDLSLAHAMIPLGSCTMKLNATSEMVPVTWPEFADIHPFAPAEQTAGYRELFAQLETWLAEITGFAAVSLQPNAGSQGEYAGLLVISAYHEARGEGRRDVCLIPASAHGTNPASAVVAGMKVVVVACDERGNIDVADLRTKAAEHRDTLAALMVTYPSTHGVFEESITEICAIVHEFGGQVYMDGANMNAQVGLTSPGVIGADVCHLNLHKTFCIPHGGGGPGMGPIGVAAHLAPYLPGHPVVDPFGGTGGGGATGGLSARGDVSARRTGGQAASGTQAIGPVSAAPWGSPSILTISWVYIALMGAAGLKRATEMAILNANYMAKRLEGHYDVLYTGEHGTVAHEFIIDCREFEKTSGVKVEDIAKRLMDYSFHAPTMSFPVPGTLMIEPTESEPLSELDRLCDALIAIRQEIREIEEGGLSREDNMLKHAPHTAEAIASDSWAHPYSRERAAYPMPGLRESKFWPASARVDNPYGDRHLVCTCPPVESFA